MPNETTPWRVAYTDKTALAVVDERGKIIAVLGHGCGVAGNANAPVLAAAPQLRAALQSLVSMLKEDHETEVAADHHGDGRDGCSYCDAIGEAEAALSKAEAQPA